jgi:hypothetical protein
MYPGYLPYILYCTFTPALVIDAVIRLPRNSSLSDAVMQPSRCYAAESLFQVASLYNGLCAVNCNNGLCVQMMIPHFNVCMTL